MGGDVGDIFSCVYDVCVCVRNTSSPGPPRDVSDFGRDTSVTVKSVYVVLACGVGGVGNICVCIVCVCVRIASRLGVGECYLTTAPSRRCCRGGAAARRGRGVSAAVALRRRHPPTSAGTPRPRNGRAPPSC